MPISAAPKTIDIRLRDFIFIRPSVASHPPRPPGVAPSPAPLAFHLPAARFESIAASSPDPAMTSLAQYAAPLSFVALDLLYLSSIATPHADISPPPCSPTPARHGLVLILPESTSPTPLRPVRPASPRPMQLPPS